LNFEKKSTKDVLMWSNVVIMVMEDDISFWLKKNSHLAKILEKRFF